MCVWVCERASMSPHPRHDRSFFRVIRATVWLGSSIRVSVLQSSVGSRSRAGEQERDVFVPVMAPAGCSARVCQLLPRRSYPGSRADEPGSEATSSQSRSSRAQSAATRPRRARAAHCPGRCSPVGGATPTGC